MDTEAALMPDISQLPDEPAVLKQLVVQLFAELQKTKAALERQEHHMHLLLRRLYGGKSEKFDPQQGLLFDLHADDEADAAEIASPQVSETPPSSPRTVKNRDKHGRSRIPDTIEREEVIHDLTESEKESLGGEDNLIELPPDRSEQLDWRPSTLVAVVHVRKKYARREQLPESGLATLEQNVITASKPAEAIPGGLAGPGLLAQVIVSKYTDHLPLHRLEGVFLRQGMRISRQTMDDWVLRCAELCLPLHRLMSEIVLESFSINTDDTPVKVRNAWKKQKYTGRFWTYVGDALHPLTVFDYTDSRKRDGPATFLRNYGGYLQADAFSGYDGIFTASNGRIVEAGCWAHARRKFYESRRLDPPRMETALAWIAQLYAVEKDLREWRETRWRELSPEEQALRVAAERQERSRPLLDDFRVWLDREAPQVVPKSPARAAMDYALSNWAALYRYTESGWLDADNNKAENALRGICLGRKNWLFCGSDRGGRAAAVHFSLLASCKRHGHDPFVYLRDVLTRLPALLPTAAPETLLPLLPHRWKPA
jgi:transposase